MTEAAQTESLPPLREQPPQLIGERRPQSKLGRIGAWFTSPDSRAVIYLGLIIVVAGFALIAFTWSKIAATLSVPLQIPYIASGGFVGLGLIVVGVAIMSIGVKRRDNFGRIRRLEKLSATMESIKESVGGSNADSKRDSG
jgi:hypothetical protein